MRYFSSRDVNCAVSSCRAIVDGISCDGGLFIPEKFPRISSLDLNKLKNASYDYLASYILGLFFDDFSKNEIENCVKLAYCSGRFSSNKVANLVKLNDREFVLELWHGPTHAFKDVALQFLPHLMAASSSKILSGKDILILVATSGDTGKAALEGFRDVSGVKILVFYPKNGVSNIQKLQMITQTGNNLFVSAVNGNFDDAQSGVKALLTNENLKEALNEKNIIFSSANSINFGRLAPQIVYYFYAYCQMLKNGYISSDEGINVAVPTGNFGNILACYYAKKMGLNVKKLIVASNSNNVLSEFINSGVYNRNRKFYCTMSPSMDILISSNVERLLFDFYGDSGEIKSLYLNFAREGCFKISSNVVAKIKSEFYGDFCNEYETRLTISELFKEGYLCDPHTAVAFNVSRKYFNRTNDKTKTIVVSTANPYKFSKSVLESLGYYVKLDDFEQLEELNRITGQDIPDSILDLKNRPVRFKTSVDSVCMEEALKQFLKL